MTHPARTTLAAISLVLCGLSAGACVVIVHLKHDTRTTLSYTGLAKRATFLGLAPAGSLDNVRWKKLEEEIFGEPFYKQLLRRRGRR
jgi:hypothetical protein